MFARASVAREQEAAGGVGVEAVHGDGRALEAHLQFIDARLYRRPARARGIDRQPGRLVDDDDVAVDEQDAVGQEHGPAYIALRTKHANRLNCDSSATNHENPTA